MGSVFLSSCRMVRWQAVVNTGPIWPRFQLPSADCREAREELRRLEQPDSRTSRNEYERHLDWMSRYCPDLSYADVQTDVWLADRVWQRNVK